MDMLQSAISDYQEGGQDIPRDEHNCDFCERAFDTAIGLGQHKRHSHSDLLPWKDKAWLRSEYVEKEKPSVIIAAEQGCSSQTIRRHLRNFGIPLRSPEDWKRVTPKLHLNHQGYEMFASGEDKFLHHQLLSIADGADPYKVFGGRNWHTHHRNGIRWDNRPDNVVSLSAARHGAAHSDEDGER